MKTTGFTDHRARLMRLIEPQVAFHVATRNHAGQTLLHTICSKDTYTVKHREKKHRGKSCHYVNPKLKEYSEWTSVNNHMAEFTDQLCVLLQRRGADFHSPDNSGEQRHAMAVGVSAPETVLRIEIAFWLTCNL
jgi:hypothetical protein